MTREEFERIQEEYFTIERTVTRSRESMNKAQKEGNEEERKKFQREYRKCLDERKKFEATEEYKAYSAKFMEDIRDESFKIYHK